MHCLASLEKLESVCPNKQFKLTDIITAAVTSVYNVNMDMNNFHKSQNLCCAYLHVAYPFWKNLSISTSPQWQVHAESSGIQCLWFERQKLGLAVSMQL